MIRAFLLEQPSWLRWILTVCLTGLTAIVVALTLGEVFVFGMALCTLLYLNRHFAVGMAISVWKRIRHPPSAGKRAARDEASADEMSRRTVETSPPSVPAKQPTILSVQCSECFTTQSVSGELLGSVITCDSCGEDILVQEQSGELKAEKRQSRLARHEKQRNHDTGIEPDSRPAKESTLSDRQRALEEASSVKWFVNYDRYYSDGQARFAESFVHRVGVGFCVGIVFAIGVFFFSLQDGQRVGSHVNGSGQHVVVYELDGKPNASLEEAIGGACLVGIGGFVLGFLFPGSKPRNSGLV